MTFYELAEQRYSNYCKSIRREHTRESLYEGSRDLRITNRNNEERARRGEGHYMVEDLKPAIFHPSAAQTVMVFYTRESGKAPEHVTIAWTQAHGEWDETTSTDPDDIEKVCFMKDGGTFWV